MMQSLHMQPIFVLGNPRSGTSLLRLMLSCHPDILIPPESHFFLWLEEKFKKINPSSASLHHFIEELYNSRKFETWQLEQPFLLDKIKKKEPQNYSELISCVYLAYADRINKHNIRFWGDKNKLWKEKLNKIPLYFPDAFFVHLVRDGRDVACSFLDLAERKLTSPYAPKLPCEIEKIANRWKTNVNFIQAFLIHIRKKKQLTIKYEDLLTDPEKNLRKIIDMLDLPFSYSMLEYKQKRFDQIREPVEFLQWKEKLTLQPDKSNIGKYKHHLEADQIYTFDHLAHDELKRYGYLI